jgi:hypothetical protein
MDTDELLVISTCHMSAADCVKADHYYYLYSGDHKIKIYPRHSEYNVIADVTSFTIDPADREKITITQPSPQIMWNIARAQLHLTPKVSILKTGICFLSPDCGLLAVFTVVYL